MLIQKKSQKQKWGKFTIPLHECWGQKCLHE